MLALTEMIYAIAKKVARPARISVKKYEPLRSFLCMENINRVILKILRPGAHMSRPTKSEILPHRAPRNSEIRIVNPPHGDG
jgi:hypothetical protein